MEQCILNLEMELRALWLFLNIYYMIIEIYTKESKEKNIILLLLNLKKILVSLIHQIKGLLDNSIFLCASAINLLI